MECYFSKIFYVYLATIYSSSQTVVGFFLKYAVDVHGNIKDHKPIRPFELFKLKILRNCGVLVLLYFSKSFGTNSLKPVLGSTLLGLSSCNLGVQVFSWCYYGIPEAFKDTNSCLEVTWFSGLSGDVCLTCIQMEMNSIVASPTF